MIGVVYSHFDSQIIFPLAFLFTIYFRLFYALAEIYKPNSSKYFYSGDKRRKQKEYFDIGNKFSFPLIGSRHTSDFNT